MRAHFTLIVAALVLACVLPASGTVWNVSTVSALNNAVNSCASGDEIIIAAGTYMLTGSLNMDVADVILRGATGNPDDVILQGAGMNVNAVQEGIWVAADDITIMDLTVKEFYYNGIHIRGENDADRMWVYNVKIHDIGERHIKGSTNNLDANLIAEDCLIEFVQMSQDQVKTAGSVNYIGSIDAMGIDGWVIHDCLATNVIGGTGGGNAGVFLWNYANNCTVERNKIVGCGKGIALGNPSAATHAGSDGYHAQGGIVRNNMVKRANGFDNIGFEICSTKDVKFYYNSGWSDDAGYFRMIHVYNSGPVTVNLQSKYNVVRGVLFLNGATWTDTGSIIGSAPQSSWFTDSSTGNLHLTASATTCIDQAVKEADVIEDFDKNLRGNTPDKGADEYNPPAQTTVAFAQASSSGGEAVASVNLAVGLAFPSNVTVSVNYAATGGTATGGGTDYTLTAGTLTFLPGEVSKNVPITVVNDSLAESNETIIVGLSSPVNAALGSPSSHTYTIIDNDASTTLFTDGFESGNFTVGGWTTTGTVVISTSRKHTGTYSARLRQASTLAKALSTAGRTGVHVKFWVNTASLDSTEYVYCEYSPNGGTNWYSLGSTRSNGTWVSRDYTCPADADNNANFRFRFRLNASGTNEYGYIDDVEVTGASQ